MVALKGEHNSIKLRGVENDTIRVPKSNRKLNGNQLNTQKPFTNQSLDSTNFNRSPGNIFVEIDKSIDFNLNITELLKNDLSDNGVAISDSQKVLLHSLSFLVGFSVILFTAGMIKYIKIAFRKYRTKKMTGNFDKWIDTSGISLAEWKGKQTTIIRIEDYEDVTQISTEETSDSNESIISDFESKSD